MDYAKKKVNPNYLFLIITVTFLLLSSFIVKPQLLVSQNNDLNAFSYPLFNFIKDSFNSYRTIPYWQNTFLSGYPILGDPQSIIMYPFNYLSLILDLPIFFLLYYFFHIVFALIGVFLLGEELGLSKKASIVSAFLYAIAPKMIAHLEAGHINLYASYAYVPLVFLFLHSLLNQQSVKKTILFSFFLALVYVLYITTFYYLIIFLISYGIYQFLLNRGFLIKSFRYIIIAAIFFIGFTLPELLSSFELFPQLTRNLLTYEDVAGPIFAWRQFFWFLFNPAFTQIAQTEMVLYIGLFVVILALIALFYLSKKQKKLSAFLLLFCFIFAVGPKTPFYLFLFKYFPGVSLFRVPTRMWFIVSLSLSLLAGFGIDKLYQKKRIKLALFLSIVSVLEFLFLGTLRIYPKKTILKSPISKKLYEQYFSSEKSFFRIYCTVDCLTYYDALDFNLGFTTGYNPVQLSNYFWFVQEAGGYKFGSYTPSMPPYQTFVDKPQPVAKKLGILGVRFVISPYILSDVNFKLINEKEGFYLYKNLQDMPRAYLLNKENSVVPLKLTRDIPGQIKIENIVGEGEVVISEVYTKSWKVYKNGEKEKAVPKEDVIISAPITKNIKGLTFIYEPLGTPWSWYILIATYISSAFILINKKVK